MDKRRRSTPAALPPARLSSPSWSSPAPWMNPLDIQLSAVAVKWGSFCEEPRRTRPLHVWSPLNKDEVRSILAGAAVVDIHPGPPTVATGGDHVLEPGKRQVASNLVWNTFCRTEVNWGGGGNLALNGNKTNEKESKITNLVILPSTPWPEQRSPRWGLLAFDSQETHTSSPVTCYLESLTKGIDGNNFWILFYESALLSRLLLQLVAVGGNSLNFNVWPRSIPLKHLQWINFNVCSRVRRYSWRPVNANPGLFIAPTHQTETNHSVL